VEPPPFTKDGPYTVVGIPTGTLLTSTNTIATTSNTTVFAVFKATNTAYMMFLAFSGLLSGDLSIRCFLRHATWWFNELKRPLQME
jgi:hypothetical protein